MIGVTWGQLGAGVFVAIWGVGMVALGRWTMRHEEILRDAVERRAGPDVISQGRSLWPDRARWIERRMRHQRFFGRWVFPAFSFLFVLIGLALIVSGLAH